MGRTALGMPNFGPMRIIIAVITAAAVFAGGCRTPRRDAPTDRPDDAKETAAVAAVMREASEPRSDYTMSPGDLVSIVVYENLEMSRKVRVNANGMVFLPFAGKIKVGGKTPGEAQELIAKKLSTYVVSPQVTVFIEEYGNKRFFVMGEVQKPGSYPIPTESRITVLEAISEAGGFTPVAAQDHTRVLRNVNGESMKYTIEVKSITRDGQKDKDMVLQPNDVVYVPQSFF
jgi:polysaccharide export outer membrane protein